MDEIEVTWMRGFKLWWSYSWRAMALMLLLMIPVEILLFVFLAPHMQKLVPGQPPNIEQMRHTFAIMAVLWPVMMASMIALQVQGMRWMLRKAKWADFRVLLVRK